MLEHVFGPDRADVSRRNFPLPGVSDAGCRLEALERRRLLSASLAGELTVRGTTGNDDIEISLSSSNSSRLVVNVNGDIQRFNLNKVESLKVVGLAGNDVIEIDETNGDIELEGLFRGGRGRDTITGGIGDETIKGDAGNDVIDAGDGDDEVIGGAGTDDLTGGDGEDVFSSADEESEINDLTEDDGIRIRLAQAPAPVRQTVNQLRQGNDLIGLFRESKDGETVFEAEFLEARYQRSLKLNLDGAVIEDEKEIEISDLPQAVIDAVFGRYPEAEITEAETADVEGTLFYEVEVELEDGEVVRELLITPAGSIEDDEIQE